MLISAKGKQGNNEIDLKREDRDPNVVDLTDENGEVEFVVDACSNCAEINIKVRLNTVIQPDYGGSSSNSWYTKIRTLCIVFTESHSESFRIEMDLNQKKFGCYSMSYLSYVSRVTLTVFFYETVCGKSKD